MVSSILVSDDTTVFPAEFVSNGNKWLMCRGFLRGIERARPPSLPEKPPLV